MKISALLPAFAFLLGGGPAVRAGALADVSTTAHAPELMVIGGAEYYTAHLEDITTDRALVLHRGGMTSVAWKDLSPTVQREYSAEHDAVVSAQAHRAAVAHNPNAGSANHEGADIALIDGTVYHDAVITSVDPATATIRHPGGVTRVDLLELPNDLRDKVAPHYNSDTAARFEAAENREAEMMAEASAQAAADQQTQARFDAVAINFKGTITQITEAGAIMKGSGTIPDQTTQVIVHGTDTMQAVTRKGGLFHSDALFVAGAGDENVDGDPWSGKIWAAGRYTYTTVMGAPRTIPRFATSPELALKLSREGKRQ